MAKTQKNKATSFHLGKYLDVKGTMRSTLILGCRTIESQTREVKEGTLDSNLQWRGRWLYEHSSFLNRVGG